MKAFALVLTVFLTSVIAQGSTDFDQVISTPAVSEDGTELVLDSKEEHVMSCASGPCTGYISYGGTTSCKSVLQWLAIARTNCSTFRKPNVCNMGFTGPCGVKDGFQLYHWTTFKCCQ